jgi:hypothetical protein
VTNGYRIEPDELAARVAALTALGETTADLVSAAGRLAERLPLLGTAPPARHLAMRLREAAGPTGLTDAVGAADAELASFHQALAATKDGYADHESAAGSTLRGAGT